MFIKLAYAKADDNKQDNKWHKGEYFFAWNISMCQSISKDKEYFMGKKIKQASDNETLKHGINQFILECMFSKYFEEEKVNAKQEEIASPR